MWQIAPWRDEVVLDVGAGTGFHLERFHRHAQQVLAVEPDGRLRLLAMERVARLGLERVSVLAGSAERLLLADASVGVAHARFAYFFGPGCEPGLAELARVIRPGGTAFIVDNDWRSGPSHPGWPAPRGVAGPIQTASKRSGASRASRRSGWPASGASTAGRSWRRCCTTSSRPSWPPNCARSTRAWSWRSTTASTTAGTERLLIGDGRLPPARDRPATTAGLVVCSPRRYVPTTCGIRGPRQSKQQGRPGARPGLAGLMGVRRQGLEPRTVALRERHGRSADLRLSVVSSRPPGRYLPGLSVADPWMPSVCAPSVPQTYRSSSSLSFLRLAATASRTRDTATRPSSRPGPRSSSSTAFVTRVPSGTVSRA
jgi:hypothetical protein